MGKSKDPTFTILTIQLSVVLEKLLSAFGDTQEIEIYKHDDYYSIIVEINGEEKGHITINGKGLEESEYYGDIIDIANKWLKERYT